MDGDGHPALEVDLERLGFRPAGESRRGGRRWVLAFNRFLSFTLHGYRDEVVLTWSFDLGEYLAERGWQVGTTDTSTAEIYPVHDVRLPAEIDAVRSELTRVLSTMRIDLGDPGL